MLTLNDLRLAVLIDADNIPYSNVKGMLEEIAKYGTPTFKRIYGDWTKPTVAGWKSVLLENAITPVQQYSYTRGKNSTDSAMIIDAMDILYSGKVTANWTDMNISGKQRIRDLWRQEDIGSFDTKFSTIVGRHGVVMVRMWPVAGK